MNRKPDVALELARGAFWRCGPTVRGGRLLRVGSKSKVRSGGRAGSVVLGDRVRVYDNVSIYLASAGARVCVGDRSFLNRRVEVVSRSAVDIGADCAIGWDVIVTDTDYHQLDGSAATAPVRIRDRVWVGARAIILKGVDLGEGCVVAAGAVVTKDVPAGALVGGTPARVLRSNVEWR